MKRDQRRTRRKMPSLTEQTFQQHMACTCLSRRWAPDQRGIAVHILPYLSLGIESQWSQPDTVRKSWLRGSWNTTELGRGCSCWSPAWG
jgi:hypothetical protein